MTASACPVTAAVLGWARATPQSPAVVGVGGVRTYAWLAQEAERWRAAVAAHELAPRSAVALVGDLDEHLAAAWLGIRRAGHVPGMVDVGAEPQWQAGVLESMRPALVVHTGESERVERHLGHGAPVTLPEGVGYLSFSSGSQGAPKVILGSASGLAAFLDWERGLLGLEPGAATAALTSPSFDVVLRDLFLPLTSGYAVHTADRSVRWSVGRVVPWLAQTGAAAVHVVPSLSLRWASRASQHLGDLRWTVFAGEPLYARHARAWREVAPTSQMVNLYGPTETTLAAFASVLSWPLPDGLQPVGRPLPGVEVRLEPVDGEPGAGHRILIDAVHGSYGYLPDATGARSSRSLSRRDGRTSFRTQDCGLLTDEGELVVTGRLGSAVKRRGVFVDLTALEAGAMKAGGVDAACCVATADSSMVVLFVEASDVTARDILHALSSEGLHQLPDKVQVMDHLPRLPAGKVDRHLLQQEADAQTVAEVPGRMSA